MAVRAEKEVKRNSEDYCSCLLALIRAGLWETPPDVKHFDGVDWEVIFKMAEIQAISPLVLDGVSLLPKELHPPFALKMRQIGLMQQVEQANKLHCLVIAKIHNILVNNNVKDVFMKGQVVALRYRNPFHRMPGDIDFVVRRQDFSKSLRLLSTIGRVDFDMVHEHHGMACIDGVIVEPHYKVHNFQRPSTDRAMQDMFEEIFPDKLSSAVIDGIDIPTFPPTFESVFLVSHMVNHVYEEGLGLRQVIDYAVFLTEHGAEIDVAKHEEWLKNMRMYRAWRIFSCVCVEYIGTQMPSFIKPFSNKERRLAQRLLADIMQVGNFGRGAYEFRHSSWADAARNYKWVASRCVHMGFVCPSEARWWLASKALRFFAKRNEMKRMVRAKSIECQ